MSVTVGQYVMQRLQEWGVERIYAFPGDGINGITAGLRKNGDKPRFIQARHEELAAFHGIRARQIHRHRWSLHGHQRARRDSSVERFYDAKMDHQPVVAIVGQIRHHRHRQPVSAGGGSPIAVQRCRQRILRHRNESRGGAALHRSRVPHRIDQKTVTCVIFPKDIQEEAAVPEPPQKHDHALSGVGCPVAVHHPA